MREARFDNLKAFLIFSVVLCHLFELFPGTLKYRIYIFIYAFHMPLFVFISGYFAKFNFKNILCKLLYPYIIFQILYCLFTGNRIQFLTPHWILWYLLCLILWTLTLKIADKKPYLFLVLSFVLAISAGFSEKIGKAVSLARFFSFYPFFLLGYTARKKSLLEKIRHEKFSGIILLIIALILTYLVLPFIKTSWFYHSEPYAKTGETALFRIILFVIAVIFCAGFILVCPKKKIPVVSEIGRYSICVFLIHGLLVQGFKLYRNPFIFSEIQNLLLALLISVILCVTLGNRFVFKTLSPLFVFPLQNTKNVIQCIINKNKQR